MAVNHAGKLMIIQKEVSGSPGTWENLCGVNDTTFTVSNEVSSEVRVPCADRSQIVQTIKEFGAQSITFDASGLFDSDNTGQFAADSARNQTKVKLRVFIPGHGYYEYAEWLISQVSWGGAPTGSLQFSATFESSGSLTFTAV